MRTTAIRFASSLLLLVSVPAFCCTTAVVSAEASGTGRPLIWKQRDASDEYNRIAYVRGEKYGFTGLFATYDTEFKNAYAGINEAGFAISNNLSYNVRPDSLGVGGTRNGALMTQALGICATLDEFEAILAAKEHPMQLSANFAVIDALGGAAYFEVSDTAYVRFDVPAGGYLFRTNFSLSGDPDRGRGFARYETMGQVMAERRTFDPGFFLQTGRTYRNALGEKDALKHAGGLYLYEHDYIPRRTTVSSLVLEGVAPGGQADSGVLWCAMGHTACSYAVPVWVASGERIPSMLTDEAPANQFAVQLSHSVRQIDWDEKYVDVKALRRIIRRVEAAERAELKAGRRLMAEMERHGFDAAAVEKFNAEADARFARFKNQFAL
jgi:hypothetical protein